MWLEGRIVGQQTEKILLNKWLAKFHRTSLQWRRVRLGEVATKEEAKYYKVILRWCDAIYIDAGFVNIVEAKLRPDLGVIGQLEGYQKLFKITPEFSMYKDWPVKMILLTPFLDLNIVELCKDKGIIYEHWVPKNA